MVRANAGLRVEQVGDGWLRLGRPVRYLVTWVAMWKTQLANRPPRVNVN